MTISFELPHEIEQSLRNEVGDLGQAAKEALLVRLYREGRLTRQELARVLGLSRLDVDAVLKRHGVFLEMTAEDVARESEGLRNLRDRHGNCR